MRAGSRDDNSCLPEVVGRATGHGRMRDRLARRERAKENPAGGRRGAARFQVRKDRLTHERRQWIRRRVPRLALGYAQSVMTPVQIIERERRDLPCPQTVGHQEQQHRVITTTDDRTPIDCVEHAAHLVPGDGPRNRRQSVHGWRFDGAAQIAGEKALPMQVPEKHSDDAASITNTRPMQSAATIGEESAHDHRGQGPEVLQPNPTQIGFELMKVVGILHDGLFPQSTLTTQVREKPWHALREWLVEDPMTRMANKSRHYQSEHLLDGPTD